MHLNVDVYITMSYTENQYQLRMKYNMSKLEIQALPKLSIDMT